MTQKDQVLISILGDQLSTNISSLRRADRKNAVILMAEVGDETAYVPHHKKKIIFVLSAMRAFADELRVAGWTVDYVKLEDGDNTGSLAGEIERAKARHGIEQMLMTEPGEWRLKQALSHIPMREDDRFICSHAEFLAWASGRKELRMEYFYRDMRRKTGLLMHGDKPEGDRWNFDAENRKPADVDMFMAKPLRFEPSQHVRDVMDIVERRFGNNFGAAHPFWFATTRPEAEAALQHFIEHNLPSFGATQDAMLRNEPFLNHALISGYINVGLLDPLAVCKAVEAEYRKGRVSIESAEGFIRQIIGWREYIRGIYWMKMPGYAKVNVLQATRPLPDFYWTGKTNMNCIRHVVAQTREEAYAHHIQRLMITGNYALLAGLDPAAVHEWYLSVYIDAFEWVELPNTIGMALHAEGGLLGSKPYAASGNYINRMSDYCKSCHFDVKQRTGDKACPFNALYWDFIARHHARFARNPRMAQMCRSYERFSDVEKAAITLQAKTHLDSITSTGVWA